MNNIKIKLEILLSWLIVGAFLAIGLPPLVGDNVWANVESDSLAGGVPNYEAQILADFENDSKTNALELQEDYFDETTSFSPAVLRNAYLLNRLRQYLLESHENYASLQLKLDETRSEIEGNRDRLSGLQGQIQHLSELSKESASKVHNVQEQIAGKELDIGDTLKNLAFQEIIREDQSKTLSSYLRLLYFEKNLYFGSSAQANSLKILLKKGMLSSVLQNEFYLELLKSQAEDVMENLQNLEVSIQDQTTGLTRKRHELAALREQLDGEHRNLAAQLEGKKNLLNETENRDELYRELFASYRLAQEAILSDINLFESNIDLLDDRITLLAPQLSEEERGSISEIKEDAALSFAVREAALFLNLAWPVSPKLGLTAFFKDPGYAATFGVSHQALDIRVPHGSVIIAPADGVVYRVNDAAADDELKNRLGYGYLILAHRKGVMSLYGHISTSLVREGDFVKRGQIIGLTGGTPGTPGAGVRTTGAHLHFEVFQDGVRVDPFEYLPIEMIPEEVWEEIPEKYLTMIQARLLQVLEEQGVDIGELEELRESDHDALQLEAEETVKLTLPIETDGDNEAKTDEKFDEEAFWSRGED